MPRRRAVLMIRQAISPRLAMRMRLNMLREAFRGLAGSQPRCEFHATGARRCAMPFHPLAYLWKSGILLARLRFHILQPRANPRSARDLEDPMALAINDTAPDFEAQTTEGKIKFHDWIGN